MNGESYIRSLDAKTIMYAADNEQECDATVRARLLAGLGLTESR